MARGIQLLVPPPTLGRRAAGPTGSLNACIGIKIPVGGDEGCLRPIGLDEPSSGSPVLSVPEAGVDPHGLVLGKCNAPRFQVLEVSDGSAINHEAETITSQR